jgi:hypothetical protein
VAEAPDGKTRWTPAEKIALITAILSGVAAILTALHPHL